MKTKLFISNFIFKNTLKRFSGGHHHITGKVDLNKSFVDYKNIDFNNISGFYSLTGLPASKSDHSHNTHDEHNNDHSLENKEDSDVLIIDGHEDRNSINHNPFNFVYSPQMVKDTFDEENPYFHEELYGYLYKEDVRKHFNFSLLIQIMKH